MAKAFKVFGLGLNKTGTSTLGQCFSTLGYKHTSHRGDLLVSWKRGDIKSLIAETKLYESFEDWPWPLAYKDIFEEYGDTAKYILTTRETPEIWLSSLKAHSLNTSPERPMRTMAYGYKYPHGYEGEHLAFYKKHNTDVVDFFRKHAPNVLLCVCWERGDGWSELCHFLNEEVPSEKFPHVKPNVGVDPRIIDANLQNIRSQLGRLEHERRSSNLAQSKSGQININEEKL